MNNCRRRRDISIAIVLLLLLAPEVPVMAASEWPQAHSDVAPDDSISFGVLANGMRYELMRNALPTGHISFRFRIAAGSQDDPGSYSGVAHFLEHMAFRGSKHFNDGEIMQVLSTLGVRAGADANARTSQYDTIFQIDLPKRDVVSVQAALAIFRDIASNLNLRDAIVDSERKVILAEERFSDNATRRIIERRADFVLRSLGEKENPSIGTPTSIAAITATQISAFYKSHYRPDAATLIVVGDVDLADMQSRIEDTFREWQSASAADVYRAQRQTNGDVAMTQVDVEPGMMLNFLHIYWPRRSTGSTNTEESERRDLVLAVGVAALNRRFDTEEQSQRAHFLDAKLLVERWSRSVEVNTLGVEFTQGRWRDALIRADRIRRGALSRGLSQPEVDAISQRLLASYRDSVTHASAVMSPALAESLTRDLSENRVSQSQLQRLQRAEGILIGLQAHVVNAALKSVFETRRPMVWLTSNAPVAGGEAELEKALDVAESDSPEIVNVSTNVKWPYAWFGRPGKVLSLRPIDDTGATSITFANGVKLNVKRTSFAKNQMAMMISLGGGEADLPQNQPPMAWAIANAFLRGGLKKIDYPTMQNLLSDKMYSGAFTPNETAFSLQSVMRPDDLETQLQVIAAYCSDPAFRSWAFELAKNAQLTALRRWKTEPFTLLRTEIGELVRPDDRRTAQPTVAEVQSLRLQDFRHFLTEELTRGSIEITLVGDITKDAAIDAVAKTLGALKRKSSGMVAMPIASVFPRGTESPIVRFHEGRPDQGAAAIAWPTVDWLSDGRRYYALQLLASIFQVRLSERLRASLGTSYATRVLSLQSQGGPQSQSAFFVETDVSPNMAPVFFGEIDTIVADLQSQAVSTEEFDRAKMPRIAQLERNVLSDYYWVSWLDGSSKDPRRIHFAKNSLKYLNSVTPREIQSAALQYLRADKAFKVVYERDHPVEGEH